MSAPFTFTVYGQPQPAGSKRSVGPGRIVDANPRSRPWQQEIRRQIGPLWNGGLLDGPLIVDMEFYQPRPKGHYGKRGLRPSAPKTPTTRPDLLKLARGVEDALTGLLWRDDSQIVREILAKFYGEPARVEIRVYETEEE